MGKLRLALAALVVIGLVVTAPPLHSQSGPVTYLVLVKSQSPSATAAVAANVASRGTVLAELGDIGIVTATSSDPDFPAVVGADPNVQAVTVDPPIQWLPPNEQVVDATSLVPAPESLNNEPYTAYQWNMRQIHADQTAANGDVGNGVVHARVAVLDAGIVTTHPDIAPNLNLALSTSFVPTEPDLNPPSGSFNHGTHVAGIIAAPINGKGIQGVAPSAEIVAVKVLSAAGSGSFSWLIAGIEYAAGPLVHADVINMSLGATFDRINAGGANGDNGGAGPLMAALNRAINHATARGTLCVSAAGNEGVDLNGRLVSIPAQSGNGMAVSATGPIDFYDLGMSATFDRLASYSNFGQSVVNVAAPGGDSTMYPDPRYVYDMVISPGGYLASGSSVTYRYYFASGTSMAAPHVSGVAALIVGKYGHIGPTRIKAILQQSADDILKPGADAGSGKGRINALTALQ